MKLFYTIKQLFGRKTPLDIAWLVRQGAQIIDVRTEREYRQGHIVNSINIPLADLERDLYLVSRDVAAIICCASGVRSAHARNILLSLGYTQVFDGGAWMGLQRRLG